MRCPQLPTGTYGRLVVVGAGKAPAGMNEVLQSVLGPCNGLIISRYGYQRPCQGIEIVQVSHPVPDQAGADATLRMLQPLEGFVNECD